MSLHRSILNEADRNCRSHYTSHFHDWRLWPEPEYPPQVVNDYHYCPVCVTELRPVECISQDEDYSLWWFVCPECHIKLRRCVYEQVSPREADPRDELIVLMWSRIQMLEQRLSRLEAERTQERQHPPARPSPVPELSTSENLDAESVLPERYKFLLKSK